MSLCIMQRWGRQRWKAMRAVAAVTAILAAGQQVTALWSYQRIYFRINFEVAHVLHEYSDDDTVKYFNVFHL